MARRPRLFVTLEGYAVEGGFDRPYEPATCYSPTIALGRHDGPGDADSLWTQYESVLSLVPDLGFDGVRLSVEWARVEPRAGSVDEVALARYGAIVRYARSLGLEVTIVLVDAVWPAWLGLEAWLLPWVVPKMLEHARRVVEHVGDHETGIVAFAQPEQLVAGGYLDGSRPPWRLNARHDAQFARRQIASIVETLGRDSVVGAQLVGATATVGLDLGPVALRGVIADSIECDELYIRSLVRGWGPTTVSAALVERDADSWRVSASEELLDALR